MRTAYAADVAEVVVHPQDGSVLWNLEPRVEDRQDLLVRTEQLRRPLRQHSALRSEDLLQNLYLFFRQEFFFCKEFFVSQILFVC